VRVSEKVCVCVCNSQIFVDTHQKFNEKVNLLKTVKNKQRFVYN
jgi:hypothetical protein